MKRHKRWGWLLLAMQLMSPAYAVPLTREQAMVAAERQDEAVRMTGLARLAEIGLMADADRLLPQLSAADPRVRAAAQAAITQIWSRSNDAAIDPLFARGVAQIEASALADALATFDDIVRRKPAFAEGWNKRATVHFLLGHNLQSLQDCDEVLKRNPHHFGALSGAGEIHLQLGQPEQALEFFKRAFAVNPYLRGLAQTIHELELRLRSGMST